MNMFENFKTFSIQLSATLAKQHKDNYFCQHKQIKATQKFKLFVAHIPTV